MRKVFQIIQSLFLKGVLFIFFFLFSLKASAPDFTIGYILVSKPVDSYERLINAVVKVESMGDTMAFNLIEGAIGAFQIREIRLQDYNQRRGTNYKAEDCYNYAISKEIFLFYAKRIGYPDYESIAREWNGSGKKTLIYWEKVKNYL